MNYFNKIAKIFALPLVCFLLIGMMSVLAALSSYGKSANKALVSSQDQYISYLTGIQQDQLFSSADFYNYARVRDDEFTGMLKNAWQDFSIFPGIPEESRSNLGKRPVFSNSNLDMTSPINLPFTGVVGLKEDGITQGNWIPRIRRPETETYTAKAADFQFYGQQISIRFDKLLVLSVTNSVSEDSIAGFWSSFSRSNSNHLVDQLMDYRDRLGLGDWGYFQLVKAASNHIVINNHWGADQLTWALMIRSGFDVRLAFNQTSTTVLYPSEKSIFDKQYVVIGQKRFYLDREMKSLLLVASPNQFPGSVGMIDLRFGKSLNFAGKLSMQKFIVNWAKKRYELTLRFNPNIIRFYADYPKTDPAVYFDAPVSAPLKEDLLRQLYPILSKSNRAEAVALLQRFVQTEFEYCVSNPMNERSGRFAEEVIATKSGDDRGKSVLFAGLIRILLRLPVVGVHFPGYYSTAVCLEEPLDGDSYSWKRKKYLIADPTFQNAPIGVMMQELSGLTPQLIDLQGTGLSPDIAKKTWELASKMGARRGGASQDLIFDRQGRALITGYFADKRPSCPFIACVSEGNTLQWIRKFEGDGKALAFAITKINDDEIYIAGSFRGKLEMDGVTILSSPRNGALFLAQFNHLGELIWMKPVPVDSTKQHQSLAYLVKSDRAGNNISIQWMNEHKRNIRDGFNAVDETGLTLAGFGSDYSTRFSRVGPAETMDVTAELVKTYNNLKRMRCHPNVAMLMAVMKWLQMPGHEVTGTQIQTFITRMIPSFATSHPEIFNSFGRIALLKNEYGSILIKILDYKSLLFKNLRIVDGARFMVSVYDNGDIEVKVINGFQDSSNPELLAVNSLLIDFSVGDLIMDYDDDHTLKTIWMDSDL